MTISLTISSTTISSHFLYSCGYVSPLSNLKRLKRHILTISQISLTFIRYSNHHLLSSPISSNNMRDNNHHEMGDDDDEMVMRSFSPLFIPPSKQIIWSHLPSHICLIIYHVISQLTMSSHKLPSHSHISLQLTISSSWSHIQHLPPSQSGLRWWDGRLWDRS